MLSNLEATFLLPRVLIISIPFILILLYYNITLNHVHFEVLYSSSSTPKLGSLIRLLVSEPSSRSAGIREDAWLMALTRDDAAGQTTPPGGMVA